MGLFALIHRLLGRETVREAQGIRHGVDRRTFLRGALLGTVAAATLDVEQLLWTPKTQIVVPQLTIVSGGAGWTTDLVNYEGIATGDLNPIAAFRGKNTYITPQWVTREALKLLEENLKFHGVLSRSYAVEGARIGTTLNIRKPARFLVSVDEDPMDPALIVHEVETVSLDQYLGVDLHDSYQDRVGMTLAEYRDRNIKPAVAMLAEMIQNRNLNVFGALSDELSPGIEATEVVRGEAVALRGRSGYDMRSDRMRLSLDVVGGHSAVVAGDV